MLLTAPVDLVIDCNGLLTSGFLRAPKNKEDLIKSLGEGATEPYVAVEGLRHKYFGWNDEHQICCGFYCFFDQVFVQMRTVALCCYTLLPIC